MAQYESNGVRIEAESFGDESRPAVLLVMGLGMQLLAWPEALCQRLSHLVDVSLLHRAGMHRHRGLEALCVRG